jgi:hypothetical protein
MHQGLAHLAPLSTADDSECNRCSLHDEGWDGVLLESSAGARVRTLENVTTVVQPMRGDLFAQRRLSIVHLDPGTLGRLISPQCISIAFFD